MQKIYMLISVLLFGFTTVSTAQRSHKFTQITKINNGGEATKVTVWKDGTIFLANGEDGLRAYTYNGNLLTSKAQIYDGGFATDVAIMDDGTILLANGDDGLRAYTYNGSSFTNTAHSDDGGYAQGLAISSGTIFLANGKDGLRAYTYDGVSLTNNAHTAESDSMDRGIARDVAVSSDGTIFLANDWDGLRAFSYDGSSFTNTAHITAISNAFVVKVDSDNTVFLASPSNMIGPGALGAYSYKGTSFSILKNLVGNRGFLGDIAFIADKTLFLADWNGLWAYDYKDTKFNNTAHIDEGINGEGVAVFADTLIFLAGGSDGLIVYTYIHNLATGISEKPLTFPKSYALRQNFPNPFNPSTTITYDVPASSKVTLKIYNTLGQEIRTLISSFQLLGTYQVSWDGRDNQGNVLPSGVYFYQLQAGAVVQTRKMILMR